MYARTLLIIALFPCLLVCGCGKKQKSTTELIADLKKPEERDRVNAVRTLPHRTGDAAQVVPALIASLKDSHADIRRSAALGLGSFGERAKEAIPALQAAESDPDARVRESAAIALSHIDPSVVAHKAPKKPSSGE